MTREDKARAIRVRCIKEAEYILSNFASTRETALEFNVSPSTVCTDMKRLRDINEKLYKSVKQLFDYRRRRYTKKRKIVYQRILRIYGNRKGEVKSFEYVIASNYNIISPICRYTKRKYEVVVPIIKREHTKDEITAIYNKVLKSYLNATPLDYDLISN